MNVEPIAPAPLGSLLAADTPAGGDSPPSPEASAFAIVLQALQTAIGTLDPTGTPPEVGQAAPDAALADDQATGDEGDDDAMQVDAILAGMLLAAAIRPTMATPDAPALGAVGLVSASKDSTPDGTAASPAVSPMTNVETAQPAAATGQPELPPGDLTLTDPAMVAPAPAPPAIEPASAATVPTLSTTTAEIAQPSVVAFDLPSDRAATAKLAGDRAGSEDAGPVASPAANDSTPAAPRQTGDGAPLPGDGQSNRIPAAPAGLASTAPAALAPSTATAAPDASAGSSGAGDPSTSESTSETAMLDTGARPAGGVPARPRSEGHSADAPEPSAAPVAPLSPSLAQAAPTHAVPASPGAHPHTAGIGAERPRARTVEPDDLVDQVVRRVDLFTTPLGRGVEIRLDPPDLGTLHVRLVVEHGQLTMHLRAESAEAMTLFRDNLPQLRSALADCGLSAQQFTFDLGGGDPNARRQFQPPWPSRHFAGGSDAGPPEPPAPRATVTALGRIDYRI